MAAAAAAGATSLTSPTKPPQQQLSQQGSTAGVESKAAATHNQVKLTMVQMTSTSTMPVGLVSPPAAMRPHMLSFEIEEEMDNDYLAAPSATGSSSATPVGGMIGTAATTTAGGHVMFANGADVLEAGEDSDGAEEAEGRERDGREEAAEEEEEEVDGKAVDEDEVGEAEKEDDSEGRRRHQQRHEQLQQQQRSVRRQSHVSAERVKTRGARGRHGTTLLAHGHLTHGHAGTGGSAGVNGSTASASGTVAGDAGGTVGTGTFPGEPTWGATTTATSTTPTPTTTTFQARMLQSLVEDSLADLRAELRQEIQNMHLELLRQFYIQKTEVDALLRKHSPTEALLREVRELREENARLRCGY
ncbi:hypothetical protein DFJ73DRAFT_866541 [Zopfochytrium polystomum]|nr:hypothetical protein DFJ73DRAFT_866541 [Zopfochytrium polystomum]